MFAKILLLSLFACGASAATLTAPIVNHGPNTWTVIVNGSSVPAQDSKRASALPPETNDWTKFNRWQKPKFLTAKLNHYELGFPVAEFSYQVLLMHGGAPIGKPGQYIGYVGIHATDVLLPKLPESNYTLNTAVVVKAVRNIGTADLPVAEMEIELVSSLSRKGNDGTSNTDYRSVTYRVNGAGKIEKIKTGDGGFRLLKAETTNDVAQAEASCPHPLNQGGYMGLSEILMSNGPVVLVKNNKLMDHQNAPMAKALPPKVGCWNQTKGWTTMRRGFEYRWNNPLWWDFVVKGELVWMAGGKDLRGRGNYIGFATVNILEVSRGIIRSVDISAVAPKQMILNVGTDKDPNLQITFILRSEVRTKLSLEVSNWLVSIDALGNVSDVIKDNVTP